LGRRKGEGGIGKTEGGRRKLKDIGHSVTAWGEDPSSLFRLRFQLRPNKSSFAVASRGQKTGYK